MSARGGCHAWSTGVCGGSALLLWSFLCTMGGKGVSTRWLTMWSEIVSSDTLVFCSFLYFGMCANRKRAGAERGNLMRSEG